MNTSSPTPGRIFVIAAFSLSCFGLLLFFWLAFGGPIPLKPQGYRVQVAFTDAATLADQADVRTAGVTIGKVVAKELAPGGNRTLATIELKSRYAPLRSDARAILRQKTLLGETYVELTTGSAGAPRARGGRAPGRRPGRAGGRVRRAAADLRRADAQGVPRVAGEPRAGGRRPRRATSTTRSAACEPFTENARDVVDVLDDRRAALRNLVHNAGKTFEEVTRDEEALSTLVQRNSELFGELAERRDALAESIRILPTFLDETKATLARVGTFSLNTEPLLRDLDPVLDDLQPTLASLHEVAPDLENLFDNLDPLIDAGDDGLPALSRTLRGLDPTLAAAGPFLRQVNPLLRFLELNQVRRDGLHLDARATLGGIRSTVPGSKSNGHVLPQMIVTGAQTLPSLTRRPDNRGNAYPAPNVAPRPGRADPAELRLQAVRREAADEHAGLQGRRGRSRSAA